MGLLALVWISAQQVAAVGVPSLVGLGARSAAQARDPGRLRSAAGRGTMARAAPGSCGGKGWTSRREHMKLGIYCADVGSIARGRFGWAGRLADGSSPESGTSIVEFAARVSARLQSGIAVALGFECPLFVPYPQHPSELTRARRGEGSRPWCAGAGAGALAVGLTESAWVLSRVHDQVSPEPALFVSWPEFQKSRCALFLWEAFVTGRAKMGGSHENDATLAVNAFCAALPDPTSKSIIGETDVFSLVAAAALRAGWQEAASLINHPCLVLSA